MSWKLRDSCSSLWALACQAVWSKLPVTSLRLTSSVQSKQFSSALRDYYQHFRRAHFWFHLQIMWFGTEVVKLSWLEAHFWLLKDSRGLSSQINQTKMKKCKLFCKYAKYCLPQPITACSYESHISSPLLLVQGCLLRHFFISKTSILWRCIEGNVS